MEGVLSFIFGLISVLTGMALIATFGGFGILLISHEEGHPLIGAAAFFGLWAICLVSASLSEKYESE